MKAHTNKLQYIAISHVWGEAQWLSILGIEHEVLASPSKAEFIQKALPALVGNTPFWMDILSINQSDEAEKIGAVASIPSIFRNASRTICVRESDGIYECCANAVRNFTDWDEFNNKLHEHNKEHMFDIRHESHLRRLWTLQECLLSRTIEFVVSGDSMYKCCHGQQR